MKKESGVRKECLATSLVHIVIIYIAYTFATAFHVNYVILKYQKKIYSKFYILI